MKALVFERNLPRFAAARLASSLGSGRGAGVGPLRLTELDPPAVPNAAWHRVRPLLSGICGSDLSTVDGHSSRYFEDLVSFPFVPGHEVVGVVEEEATSASGGPLRAGSRVVIEPVLGCAARGIDPPCPPCAQGHTGNCQRVSLGHLRPGIQTGFCAQIGGGWSSAGLVAHHSQLHPVPPDLCDTDAVLVEPLACGLHAALAPTLHEGDTVAVVGAGTVGLTVVAALNFVMSRGFRPRPEAIVVGARYPHQRSLAQELGAMAVPADRLDLAVRRLSGSLVVGSPSGRTLGPRKGSWQLTGGADVVFDCAGTPDSLAQALALVRPCGQVVLVGMPGRTSIDLAPLWHRELQLRGSYTYGVEHLEHDGTTEVRRTFDLAFELAGHLAATLGPGRLVSAAYPLERFEEALAHAGSAGRRGSVKVVFDLQTGRRAR